MATHLAVIGENSVEKIQDEGELDAFFLKENPAAQVSAEPSFCAEKGLLFNTNFCLQRTPCYCSGIISTPVNAPEEKPIQ